MCSPRWRSWSARRRCCCRARPCWWAHSYGKISQLMEAQYLRLDPDWCKKRRERARKQRSFTITPVWGHLPRALRVGDDGMADLRGTMPLEAAAELRERLDAIARTVCPDDPRPIFTRHSDALAVLGSEHQLTCQCDKPTCQAAGRPARHAKNIELVVQLSSLISGEDVPALLNGAPIDPELARILAKAAKRITFTTTPDQSPPLASARGRYPQPTPSLETHVNTRDSHCRFPGCHRRARTELDPPPRPRGGRGRYPHIPFNHEAPESGGFTVPDNLKRLCRHHHRAKTHGHWQDQQSPDGTVHWTSPTGRRYLTTPG
ncbi:MAG: DUF222 domain-containing protein [Segniliparus sp.]|uniref:DUF222 domain-containing protein n=1 Tax=Segniliparus sp. TaxID=2804064 RepID=UPI003F317D63